MTRRTQLARHGLRLLLVVTLVFALIQLWWWTDDVNAQRALNTSDLMTQTRPNIILILTDDQDLRLGSLDYMPRLQTLVAERGVTFENAFVNVSLCCPSRASILRGQYAHNTGILTNSAPDGGYAAFYSRGLEASTVATWLEDAGYRTGFMGKYLNGYPGANGDTYVPPGWTEWYSPLDSSAYGMYNYRMNENGQIVTYGNDPDDYITDVLRRKAVDFIGRAAPSATPFFLHVATYAPHAPATPANRHANLFPGAQVPRTPAFNETDISDKPAYLQALPQLSSVQIATLDERYRQRIRSLQAVDEMMAAIVVALQASGELENTYLVFTSDNGYHMGQHRLPATKLMPYEEDIRVPLVLRGPTVAAGVTRAHAAMNIDLAPTIAEWAGVTPPNYVDGRSLATVVGANPPSVLNWRQVVLLQRVFGSDDDGDNMGPAPLTLPAFIGLRTPTHTYVEYDTGERELYDLTADPYQLANVAGSAPILEARLSLWLAELSRCAGETCRSLDTAPPSRLYLPHIRRANGE